MATLIPALEVSDRVSCCVSPWWGLSVAWKFGRDGGVLTVAGPKSTYGASRESEQSQFGLGGKTGYGNEGSDPALGGTDTSSYGAGDPLASQYDNTPRSNTQSVPGGDGWSAEDTCMSISTSLLFVSYVRVFFLSWLLR